MEGAKEGYLGFLVAIPQLAVHPLPQFYEEWCCKCTLSEWMDRVSPPLKQVLFLQNIPHTNHQVVNGPGSAGQLVHHQHKGGLLSCRVGSETQEFSHSPVGLASVLAGICNQLKEEQPPTSLTVGVFGGWSRLIQPPGRSVGTRYP